MVMCAKKMVSVSLQAFLLRGKALRPICALLCSLGISSASAALQERLDSVIVCDSNEMLRYEYAYNANGKLRGSKVYKQDGNTMILQRASSYGYDAFGRNNARTDSVRINGTMKLECMYDITYTNDSKVSQVKCSYPLRGTTRLSCDSVYYTYDKDGSLLRYVCMDCDTKDTVEYKNFVYDEHERCIECRVTEKSACRLIDVGVDRYEYVANGRVAKEVHMAPTTGFRTETLNEYDSIGHCVLTQMGYTTKPEMEWHTKNVMTYDERGNLLYVKGYMMTPSGWRHDKTKVYVYDMERENVPEPECGDKLFLGHGSRFSLTENPPCSNRLMRADCYYCDGDRISSTRYWYSDDNMREW